MASTAAMIADRVIIKMTNRPQGPPLASYP